MAGIAAILQRNRAPVDEGVLRQMSIALGHRGRDGVKVTIRNSIGLGVQNFFTVPEEFGMKQPLSDLSGELLIGFDGRLDNREELLGEIEEPLQRPVSDAQVVLAAYRGQGLDCIRRLVGPFALALYDAKTRRVVCARDALGDRTLFYHLSPEHLLVGSEERAVLQHPSVSSVLNREHVAGFFALRPPTGKSSFYRDVSELEPGCLLEVGEHGAAIRRFWSPEEVRAVRYRRDEEYSEAYREHLDRAVRARLRSIGPVAVMLSGGLDSTSLAALAQRHAPPEPTLAVSWVFDKASECDERMFLDPVLEQLGLTSLRFVGDRFWPLFDRRRFSRNRNTPEENPYRGLKQEAYRTAARAGCRVVLNGGSADVLYAVSHEWLKDLVREGRVVDAARGCVREGSRRGLRAAVRSLLPLVGRDNAGILGRRTSTREVWLTEFSRGLLAAVGDSWRASGNGNRALRWHRLHASRQARGVTVEIFHANREGVELRHPYRDRRLVEFMLGLPAHQLYREGRHKPIARRAMETLLPREVLDRRAPTLLTPFYRAGLRHSAAETVRQILFSGEASWPEYVRREFIAELLESPKWRRTDDLVLWNCLSFELWRRS